MSTRSTSVARLALAVAGLLGLTAMPPAPAAAAARARACQNEGNTSGSVDGRTLAYDLDTRFTTEWNKARDNWNSLRKVNIKPDGATDYADVDVSDVTRSDVTWSGLWSPSGGADDIYFNRHFLDGYAADKKQGVVGHEIGHALRLGHFNNRGALMHCDDGRTTATWQQPDKDKYHSIWGN